MDIQDVINKIVADEGQSTVARKIGESDSTLSRFRSGQGGFTMATLQRLLDEYGYTIAPADSEKKLEDALEVLSDLWKKARNNGNGHK